MSNQYPASSYKYWYLPIISGILFAIFGFYILSTPLTAYIQLSIFFAAIFFVSGIFEIFNAFSNQNHSNWGWALVSGIIDVLFGGLLLSSPALSASVLPIYIGMIVLFRSITAIGHSTSLKQVGVSNWQLPLIFGILGVIFAFLMIINPIFGGMTIVFYTGISIIMFGFLQVTLGISLKKLKKYESD